MAANYQQPEYVEKRLRYFDGQFLKDQDFIDEQKYHIDRQRRLSRILQVSGISEGLGVTSTAADTVSVAAGTAVDPKGRLIVLAEPQEVSVAGKRNQTVNLFISYQEVESDKAQEGSEGNRRWHEKPQIQAVAESGPAPQDSIKLAKLNIDKDGVIKVDDTVRQYSGVKLPAAGSNGPTLRSADDSTAVLAGNLSVSGSITAGSATIKSALTVTGNVGIGTHSPEALLNVMGNQPTSGSDSATQELLKISRKGPTQVGSGYSKGSHFSIGLSYYENPSNHYPRTRVDFNTTEKSTDNTTTPKTVMSLRDDGNVGIGTTTPSEKLEVSGNLKASGSLTAAGATISGNLSFGTTVRQMINLWKEAYGIGVQGGTQYFRTDKNFAWYKGGSHNDGELNAGIGGTVQMAIKDGNVGIGTANPTEKLEVAGNIKATGSLTAAGATISGALTVTGTGNVGIGGASQGEKLEVTGNIKATGSITAASATINGALTATGNVGIGGASQGEKLEVTGNIKATGSITAGSATINGVQTGTDGRLNIYSNTTAKNSRAWIELWGKDDNRSGELTLAGTYIVFRSNSTETVDGNEQMRLTSDGKLGIGTPKPSEKLEVSGNIKATGSITAGSAIFSSSGGSNNNIEFSDTSNSQIFWKSKVNMGSDKAFLLFKDNSTYVVSSDGTENIRLSIGVYNDFGQTQAHGDALDIQGGARLTLNAGKWDRELNEAIGTPETGNFIQGISFRINDTERMQIDKNGNVGIGTTSPTEKLEVAGNIKVSGYISFAQKPFQVVRYTNLGDNPRRKTDYKTSEWGAIIAGYSVTFPPVKNMTGMYIYMAKTADGYWQITGDIVGPADQWPEVYVMFIKSSWIDMGY